MGHGYGSHGHYTAIVKPLEAANYPYYHINDAHVTPIDLEALKEEGGNWIRWGDRPMGHLGLDRTRVTVLVYQRRRPNHPSSEIVMDEPSLERTVDDIRQALEQPCADSSAIDDNFSARNDWEWVDVESIGNSFLDSEDDVDEDEKAGSYDEWDWEKMDESAMHSGASRKGGSSTISNIYGYIFWPWIHVKSIGNKEEMQ